MEATGRRAGVSKNPWQGWKEYNEHGFENPPRFPGFARGHGSPENPSWRREHRRAPQPLWSPSGPRWPPSAGPRRRAPPVPSGSGARRRCSGPARRARAFSSWASSPGTRRTSPGSGLWRRRATPASRRTSRGGQSSSQSPRNTYGYVAGPGRGRRSSAFSPAAPARPSGGLHEAPHFLAPRP